MKIYKRMKRSYALCFTLLMMLLSSILTTSAIAQCSDAGICSIENQLRDRWRPSIMLTYLYGKSGSNADSTQSGLTFQTLMLSGEAQLFTGTSIWASLPLNHQSGPLGSVTGIGDLIVIVNQKLLSISSAELSVGAGGRFATATVKDNNLPQSYQSGLGSNDLILEADIISRNFNLGIGYQLAGGRSLNEITRLKRGDSFIIRGGYTYRVEHFDLGGELLAIKQIQESTVLNPLSQGSEFVAFNGSDQFQINILLKSRYNFNDSFGLTATVGIPLLKREVNLDGLTRVFSASVGVAVDL